MTQQAAYIRRIRFWLAIFIVGLVLSGITAFPLQTELSWLVTLLRTRWLRPIAESVHLLPWVERVNEGLTATNAHHPFLAYGTDWLAFAHLVIAVAFVGPYLDPVRNKWVITFGLIACEVLFLSLSSLDPYAAFHLDGGSSIAASEFVARYLSCCATDSSPKWSAS
jgi:hypothetical protein